MSHPEKRGDRLEENREPRGRSSKRASVPLNAQLVLNFQGAPFTAERSKSYLNTRRPKPKNGRQCTERDRKTLTCGHGVLTSSLLLGR
jgi:hypothetical protein